MDVLIKKWGNSAAVRIPAPVLEAAKFTLDQRVSVRVKDGCVVLEPVIKQDFDIDELLNGITLENAHSAVDFGKPVGQEAW